MLTPVAPVRPPAAYLGGKRNLSKRLVDLIGATPHDLYAEPFVGMGGVFFRRDRRPKVEVVNDVSADVANLFRILQRHYQAFLDFLKWQVTSRAEFERLQKTDPATLTDLERAGRFLYLQRTAFGGKIVGQNFGISRTSAARFDLTKLVPILEAAHERLASVVIEQLPYADLIRRYDRPGALFYLDPPYVGCEGDYGAGVFGPADFDRIAAILGGLKGRFILSINDHPIARAAFSAFAIDEVGVTYRVSGEPTAARELIITGPGN